MQANPQDQAPSEDSGSGTGENESSSGYAIYSAGLAFALLLTATSFLVAKTHLLWPPGLPVGLDGIRLLPQRRTSKLGSACRVDVTLPLSCISARIRT